MKPEDYRELIGSIEIVIKEGEDRVDPDLWSEIKTYLLELKDKLEKN